MNRKEFDKLKKLEQIKYINKELENGKSLTKLSDEINISRSTLRKRFEKLNYNYNKKSNKYVCDEYNINTTQNKVIPKTKQIETNNTSKNISKKEVAAEKSDADNTDITYKEKLKKLTDNIDKIIDMLEWFEKNKTGINKIDISKLNKFNLKTKNRSFNINEKILNKFVEYCNNHKEYQQTQVISIALLEFLEKYK